MPFDVDHTVYIGVVVVISISVIEMNMHVLSFDFLQVDIILCEDWESDEVVETTLCR